MCYTEPITLQLIMDENLYLMYLAEAQEHCPWQPLKPQSIRSFLNGGWKKYGPSIPEAWPKRLSEHYNFHQKKLTKELTFDSNLSDIPDLADFFGSLEPLPEPIL